MNYSLSEALKYQQRERLSVAQIHPSLRFTRLGETLRQQATQPDEVGALAHSALTADHSQPLPLMPFHLLRDKLQEQPDHPLASREFNWQNLPERLELDEHIRTSLGKWNTALPANSERRLSPYQLSVSRQLGGERGEAAEEFRKQVHARYPDLTPEHIDHSTHRLSNQWHLSQVAQYQDAALSNGDPDSVGLGQERVHQGLGHNSPYSHADTYA